MPVDFGVACVPLTAREEGVKLGESTLKRFLTLQQQSELPCEATDVHLLCANLSAGAVDEAALPTSWLKAHPSPARQLNR